MITIVIPTRNRVENLRNTVRALLNQSLDKSQYEVVISDDNSTDNTFQVYQENKSNGRLKYVNNNTKPHSWNASIPRNLGASVGARDTQAYIFVDSDVILPAHALATYKEDFDKNSNRVMIGYYDFMDKNGTDVLIQDVRHLKFETVQPDEVFNTVHDGLACFGGNIMIPKDIFWKVSGFSEDIHIGLEDGDMGLKLWKIQAGFSYDNRIKGLHQWHESPPDRFPPDMKNHIDYLNKKHFNTDNPDYGIIEASRETYAKWGISDWRPPQEWLRMNLGMKINKV